MTFDQSAFKSSDVYQVKDEVAGQMKDYQTFKKQQAEARKVEQENGRTRKPAMVRKKPGIRQKPLQGNSRDIMIQSGPQPE
ncbi:hypothetical protein RCO48_33210 [Peribacillus frigoritolerans]|nr:hypothetical protein [Peribacillus frigoritolerans]